MRIWFADTYKYDVYLANGGRRVLVSYADVKKSGSAAAKWLTDRPEGTEVFLDSGAFSVLSGPATATV